MAGISDVIPLAVFQGSGSRGPFDIVDGETAIPFAANSHLYVLRIDAEGQPEELELGVHYDLDVTLDSTNNLYTGSLTLRNDQDVLAAASGSTPAERLAVWREQPLDQSLAIAYNAAIPSRSFDQLHNKVIMIDQELRLLAESAVRVPIYESGAADLGDKLLRKGKVVAGNANTGVLEMATIASLAGASGEALVEEFNFTSTLNQQSFTLENTRINVAAAVLVWVGGARQASSSYTLTLSGDDTILDLGEQLAAGVEVDVLVLGNVSATDLAISAAMTPVVQAATLAAAMELLKTGAFTAAGGATARTLADRAADVMSVMDFGAVGDCTGVSTGTDDSAAVQAAFDWWVAAADRTLVINRRTRIGATCTANFAGRKGARLIMTAPITPDPGIGNAFEFINGDDVELYLLAREGGQTADFSQCYPSGGADQAFYVRALRGAQIYSSGQTYKGRVTFVDKERSGELKTSNLTFGHLRTGDFGSASCGQAIYARGSSAWGSIDHFEYFWDDYGPVFENIADLTISSGDGGWNAGNNGMEFRGVITLQTPALNAGDETQTVDLFMFKPSVSDTVTHNATNYTAIADSVGIEPGVTSGWASYWSATGAGGDAWEDDKHYIAGRNCANIDAHLFAFKGKKGVVLNSIGSDSSNCSGKFVIRSRENVEHGLHVTTSTRLNIDLDSVGDEVSLETVGACSGKVRLISQGAELQGLLLGADAADIEFSGRIKTPNASSTANTDAVVVNSTGDNIVFRNFEIESTLVRYAYNLVASNKVQLLAGHINVSGGAVAFGATPPLVCRNVLGVGTPTAASSLRGSASTDAPQAFVNTTDAASVMALRVEGDRATPTTNDSVYMSFYQSDSAGNQDEFARIGTLASDVTSTSEDADLRFWVVSGGMITQKMRLSASVLGPTSNDGLALGGATVSFADLFLASGGVINWNNGNVTLTHAAGQLTNSGAWINTGMLTATGGVTGGVQDLNGAGAVNLTTLITKWGTTAADAGTLADGAQGQIKIIMMDADGGDGTLTPTNFGNGTTITFNDVGDCVMLQFINSDWWIISNNGCTIA